MKIKCKEPAGLNKTYTYNELTPGIYRPYLHDKQANFYVVKNNEDVVFHICDDGIIVGFAGRYTYKRIQKINIEFFDEDF